MYITVLVADDHPILLKGLIDELKTFNYIIIAAVDNGAKALSEIINLRPNVAILDIEMPLLSGFEVIEKCSQQNIGTKFIILTSHKEKGFITKAKNLKIDGYILKDEPAIELHKCIQEVMKGKTYFSTEFNEILDQKVAPEMEKIKFLTPSERTIIRLVAQGQSSQEIGTVLSISIRTVEKHRSNIITKLDLSPEMNALTIWANEHKELILGM